MSKLNELMAAVATACIASEEAEISSIITEGQDAFDQEMKSLASTPKDLLLLAKGDGNIYSPAIQIYTRISAAMAEMIDLKHGRTTAAKEYEEYTGFTLESVLAHNADKSMRPQRSKSVICPILTDLRKKREEFYLSCENQKLQLKVAEHKIKHLVESEQQKVMPLLEEARLELNNKEMELSAVSKEIAEITEYCKVLEDEYGYSLNDKGEKVYNKSEYSEMHRAAIKAGRIALAEFKRFEKLSGIESVIPSREISKARVLFRVA